MDFLSCIPMPLTSPFSPPQICPLPPSQNKTKIEKKKQKTSKVKKQNKKSHYGSDSVAGVLGSPFRPVIFICKCHCHDSILLLSCVIGTLYFCICGFVPFTSSRGGCWDGLGCCPLPTCYLQQVRELALGS